MDRQVRGRREVMRGAAAASVLVLAALAGEAAAQATCAAPIAAPPTTSHSAVAALGKHLYWIAGTDGAPSTHARRFDVKTRRWETIPEPDGERIHPALVTMGGSLYLIGGVGNGLTGMADVQRFDPKRCEWRSFAMLPFAPGSPQVAVAGDRIVIAGGRVDNGAHSLYKLEIWSSEQAVAVDAKGNVSKLPALATARSDGAAVTVGGDVWVLGGNQVPKGEDTIGRGRDEVEILAAGATEWTSGPDLPFSAEVFAVALPDKTVVAFGRGVLESKKPAIYDPKKKAWRTGKDRPEKLEFLEGVAVIDGVIYALGDEIAGGFGGKKTYRVATYDPRKDRWVIVNEVADNRP